VSEEERDHIGRGRFLVGTGIGVAGFAATAAAISAEDNDWWLPPLLALGALLILWGGLTLNGPSLRRLWMGRPRLPRKAPEASVGAPAPAAPGFVALLPILLPTGQLRITLRPRDGGESFMMGVEVDVTGPDGTYRLVRADPRHAHWKGVYFVQYPRDFDALPVRPGKYMAVWYDRTPTGQVVDHQVQMSDRFPVAMTYFEVCPDLRIRPLKFPMPDGTEVWV
jgi:hypothetical protein